MPSREFYQVTGGTIIEITNSLNLVLQRIGDRLDKLEGIRGDASVESDLDMNGKKIVNAGLEEEDASAIIARDVFGG